MIKDQNLYRRWHSLFIPAKDFNSVGLATLSALTLAEGTPNTLSAATITLGDQDDTGIILAELGTTGFLGLRMNTAGMVVQHLMPAPRHIDFKNDLQARVHWTSGSATTADTIDWKVFYEQLAANGTLTGTINDALNTVIAQDTVAGAWAWQVTEAGVLTANTILPASTPMLLWQVEMDAKAAGLTEDIMFLGLELAYLPKISADDESHARRVNAPW